MKSIILVALALVAITLAAPVDEVPQTIRSEFEHLAQGGYHYLFETDNGILRHEDGEVREVFDEDKKPHNVVVVRGSYTYKNVKGDPETINYTADEFGYHAEGASIPQVPEHH